MAVILGLLGFFAAWLVTAPDQVEVDEPAAPIIILERPREISPATAVETSQVLTTREF